MNAKYVSESYLYSGRARTPMTPRNDGPLVSLSYSHCATGAIWQILLHICTAQPPGRPPQIFKNVFLSILWFYYCKWNVKMLFLQVGWRGCGGLSSDRAAWALAQPEVFSPFLPIFPRTSWHSRASGCCSVALSWAPAPARPEAFSPIPCTSWHGRASGCCPVAQSRSTPLRPHGL